MIRELVGSLDAWDAGAGADARLQAGLVVSVVRLRREPPGSPAASPYFVDFECGGRTYSCPLYRFQARTRTAELESAEAFPERKVAAG